MQEFPDTDNIEFVDAESIQTEPEKKSLFPIIVGSIFALISITGLAAFFTYTYLTGTPSDFPVGTELTIEPGTSTKAAVAILKEAKVIRSEFALLAYLKLNHQNDSIKASTYSFTNILSLAEVAQLLTVGDNSANLIRLTHKEGETMRELATIADEVLVDFDEQVFLQLADDFEGKLFPETYFIPKDYTAEELYTLVRKTFDEKIQPLSEQIQNHPLTLDEIIILASILEREANSPQSMRMVSGILQTRLEIGMALQVDASMEYVLQKPLSELTAEDLKTDSPYNTYLYPDLPPTPIGNPGLEAITAVLTPEPSNYLFYITGDDGNFYYAEDFDQHRINIQRHLR